MTFSYTFSIAKPTLFEQIQSRCNPPLFRIIDENLRVLLAPHLREPARELRGKIGNAVFPTFKKQDSVTLYYPGCGQDLVWPVLILNTIAPGALVWTIIGQDTAPSMGALISTMQTLTGNTFYSRISRQNKRAAKGFEKRLKGARFRFHGKIVDILFSQGDALEQIPSQLENEGYDIYFERGFEFCRSQNPSFIETAIAPLRTNGLAITDKAFARIPSGIKQIPLPRGRRHSDWGFYKSPAIYKKK